VPPSSPSGAKQQPAKSGAGAPGKRAEPGDTLRSWARLALEVAAIWVVVHTLFIAGYRIPSGSMDPTLQVGDFLFVTPLPYGPHIPFTSWNLPGFADPPRGSINVYQSPPQHYDPTNPVGFFPDDSIPIVVKRIVAIPGDTILMRDGVFSVNGVEQTIPVVPAPGPSAPHESNKLFAWQHPYELHGSRFGEPPATITHDDWGPLRVPAEHYFSLGDNRYNSIDARYYGFIPRKNFRGRPLIIYFSYDAEDWRLRWRRLGKWLWHA
jgi:signal peptidase I